MTRAALEERVAAILALRRTGFYVDALEAERDLFRELMADGARRYQSTPSATTSQEFLLLCAVAHRELS